MIGNPGYTNNGSPIKTFGDDIYGIKNIIISTHLISHFIIYFAETLLVRFNSK
ncbi:MAG: hypothetical protein V3V16_08695 [Melioribacteraceae bacterium]